MIIDSAILDHVIHPILEGSLFLPVDDFVLNVGSEAVRLAAEIKVDDEYESIFLLVRDPTGRNLGNFFTRKNKVLESDTLNGTGILAGGIRVEFRKIWPPTRSSIHHNGELTTSSAEFHVSEIVIAPPVYDKSTDQETEEMFERLKSLRKSPRGRGKTVTSQKEKHQHIAIFAGTQLGFSNGGTKQSLSHPFWGGSESRLDKTWDGEVLGGTFSLQQDGKHLKLGFRHEGGDSVESAKRFEALIQAVSYAHAILPWPCYRESRHNGCVLERILKVSNVRQGSFRPLRSRHGFQYRDAPNQLLDCLANHFMALTQTKADNLRQLLWVFRGADTRQAPAPLQIAMVCSVIEGLRSELFQKEEESAGFKAIKQKAKEWIKDLEISIVDQDERSAVKRLKSRIGDWSYADRRIEWQGAFGQLFHDRDSWVSGVFALFNNNRHGPAHGRFDSLDRGEPHEAIDALGRLAGFVNIVIAAWAGYRGPILESPLADSIIDLGKEDK